MLYTNLRFRFLLVMDPKRGFDLGLRHSIKQRKQARNSNAVASNSAWGG
jgi:hypothetical protein